MPEISRFFGVVIRMFAEPGGPHHRPHFHAYYQDSVAIIAIDPIEVIAGAFQAGSSVWSRHGRRFTFDLADDWSLLQSGRAPEKIEPLR